MTSKQDVVNLMSYIIRLDMGPKKKSVAVAEAIYKELAVRGLLNQIEGGNS